MAELPLGYADVFGNEIRISSSLLLNYTIALTYVVSHLKDAFWRC